MNMQALQQDTLLKGGAYRIEKILSQSDLEITYLSDKFGDSRDVVVTEFFVKDICRREKNNSVEGDMGGRPPFFFRGERGRRCLPPPSA